MASPRPVVWRNASIHSFLQYISTGFVVASTVIICCSQRSFLDATRESVVSAPEHPDTRSRIDRSTDAQPLQNETADQLHFFSRPTLQLLSTASKVKLVFCPDITHLRAYLANYSNVFASRYEREFESRDVGQTPTLAILNLFELHRPTSAFSAQGLNRTLANAVEAAFQTRSLLVIAECPLKLAGDDASEISPSQTEPREITAPTNSWEEEISILNVTTKSFGVGDRGWAGRTASLRSIAERWCRFVDKPPTHYT